MELVEFGPLSEAQRLELEGDEVDPWDGAGLNLHWRPKERHVGLRDDRSRLVASAGMLVADVEVDGRRFPVVGLGGVIVKAACRGRGFAREVVTAAVDRARALGPEFMILFCHEDRTGLYRRLGFAEVEDVVEVEDPSGLVAMPMRTMWLGLSPGVSWPAGPVRLHGLPF